MEIRRWLAAVVVLAAAGQAQALTADEILLIDNANSPVSEQTAKFYAAQRHVPDHQILSLDLDSREEISRDDYVHKIAEPVRAFLHQNDPQQHIKCLLTFIGLPIRVANRTITQEQQDELKLIRDAAGPAEAGSLVQVTRVEALAAQLDPAFKPPTELTVLPAIAVRADAAISRILQQLETQHDPAVRRAVLGKLFDSLDVLTGPSGHLQRAMFRDLPLTPTSGPSTNPTTQAVDESELPINQISSQRAQQLNEAKQRIDEMTSRLKELLGKPSDPAARADLRDLARAQFGTIVYARILSAQADELEPSETSAAVDSELALVKWGDSYPLPRWIENPLYFRNGARTTKTPPVMMTMRLDGPQDGTARDIIASSIHAEDIGLGGNFVIDSRGIMPTKADGSPDPYGVYDQTLRNLAEIVKTRTSLPLVFDEKPTVLPPNSVKDVGLYVGWYAVRNYIPSCQFRPGAVAFHVASLEMISLKQAGERGWVAGLLNDGVAATLGAVNEPYLHSFPKADEFFPLLLTGQLTLAEVYWRTNPLVSWQISFIGDPLYTPFKLHPAIKTTDLPITLQPALHGPIESAGPTESIEMPAERK